jgi:hypothetical protein
MAFSPCVLLPPKFRFALDFPEALDDLGQTPAPQNRDCLPEESHYPREPRFLESALCSWRIWQKSIDFMGDCHFSPGRTMKILPHFLHRNDVARRFDWPAFLRALGNRPDKAPQPRTYSVTHSTGVSETTLHCAIVRSLCSRRAPFRFDFRNARLPRVAPKEDDGGSTAAAGVILDG